MFIKEPWFWRGAQSAAFYYISCAPCTKLTDRRKRRKESQKAKAEKAREMVRAGSVNAYPDHPLPSGTNPYWKEEMLLGPGPPHKRRKKEDEVRLAAIRPNESGAASSSGSKGASSDRTDGLNGAPEVMQESRDSEDGWNRRRYQREDETLWGLDETMSHSTGMSSVSHRASQSNYYYARNPAVNDLHPPVVSTAPASRFETQWMLQPPPKAKIMEGKERANRSRSASGTSNGSRGSSLRKASAEPGLSRQISERLVENKLRQGDPNMALSVGMSRSRGSSNQSHVSRKSASNATSMPIKEQRQGASQTKDTSYTGTAQGLEPPSPVALGHPTISSDIDPKLSSLPPPRPPLSTIPSTSLVAKGEGKKPPDQPHISETTLNRTVNQKLENDLSALSFTENSQSDSKKPSTDYVQPPSSTQSTPLQTQDPNVRIPNRQSGSQYSSKGEKLSSTTTDGGGGGNSTKQRDFVTETTAALRDGNAKTYMQWDMDLVDATLLDRPQRWSMDI